MFVRLTSVAIAILLALWCSGCAPKESFSWIDRKCFVADWTNHHSCVSCCRNGNCGQAYPKVQYETLVLGDQPANESSPQSWDGGPPAANGIDGDYETSNEER